MFLKIEITEAEVRKAVWEYLLRQGFQVSQNDMEPVVKMVSIGQGAAEHDQPTFTGYRADNVSMEKLNAKSN